MGKIVGLDKVMYDIKNRPIINSANESEIILGDMLYIITQKDYRGEDKDSKDVCHKIARRLCTASTEIDLSTDEISTLLAVAATTEPKIIYWALIDALENGGLKDAPASNGAAVNGECSTAQAKN